MFFFQIFFSYNRFSFMINDTFYANEDWILGATTIRSKDCVSEAQTFWMYRIFLTGQNILAISLFYMLCIKNMDNKVMRRKESFSFSEFDSYIDNSWWLYDAISSLALTEFTLKQFPLYNVHYWGQGNWLLAHEWLEVRRRATCSDRVATVRTRLYQIHYTNS